MVADEYKRKIELYRSEGSDDEWFYGKACDAILEKCNSSEAYDAIKEITFLAVSEVDSGFFYYHIQFLIRLGRAANTTESPAELKGAMSLLIKKAEGAGEEQERSMQELCAWFSLPFNKAEHATSACPQR